MKTRFSVVYQIAAFLAVVCYGEFQIAAQEIVIQRQNSEAVKTQNLNLFDKTRNRPVPVVLYLPQETDDHHSKRYKLAVISHGYGGKNTDYSFIAKDLIECGYIAASVQHDLSADAPMPITGDIFETRRPSWERGAQSILFVVEELKKMKWNLDYQKLLLVGHSNGGDISMLFAAQHPDFVGKIISLDNRRMPFPRRKRLRILSIRSSDQTADPGVLPTAREQKRFRIRIVQANVVHNDMWNGATESQKLEMIKIISGFLRKS